MCSRFDTIAPKKEMMQVIKEQAKISPTFIGWTIRVLIVVFAAGAMWASINEIPILKRDIKEQNEKYNVLNREVGEITTKVNTIYEWVINQ